MSRRELSPRSACGRWNAISLWTVAVLICFGLGSLLFGSFDYVSVNVDGGRTSLEQRVYTKEHKETDSTNYVEELMYKYKSDKSRDDHSYVKLYNMLFANIRHTVTNITEIGISAAWFRYFPNAEIHAFDVKWYGDGKVEENLNKLRPRVHAHIVDILSISNVTSELGFMPESMDIVIDDGPHTVSSQELFLQKMFHTVKPGGFYIIEDIGIAGGGNGLSVFHDDPTKLQNETRAIIEGHDTIFVDTAVGHRQWDEWLRGVGGMWAKDHSHHNSYMIVIQKRLSPLRDPPQMHYRESAMDPDSIVIED
ncbi:hypothetical protein THAOC_15447 [Thalassiosira oceanica]|uniref:Methyltransferase domain-containing protein n=1 Tax=Thalassiosira oceanica TaxID=159749 RepID=K0SCM7_THAOC|nr:hypothetical protein THAOC_15447 [Thalassiosira oceanica]|eukprot:EJK63873.1 hypothetical protein THAOC_15447 [Thalassiosira oceanica]